MIIRKQAADFGPKTALKIVDRIRDGIKAGRVKTADDTRKALKVSYKTIHRYSNCLIGTSSGTCNNSVCMVRACARACVCVCVCARACVYGLHL